MLEEKKMNVIVKFVICSLIFMAVAFATLVGMFFLEEVYVYLNKDKIFVMMASLVGFLAARDVFIKF